MTKSSKPKKALYQDMTGFGLIPHHLSQVIGAALKKDIAWKELLEHEHEVRGIAGMGTPHPANKSPLSPFVESVFAEVKAWMPEKKDDARLVHFAKVLNGEESEEYEFRYDPSEVANLKTAPLWFTQILEIGEKLLEHSSDPSLTGEKMGTLLGNIPGDTTLGMISQSFLRELFTKPPHVEKARLLWPYLKGEKPLHCKVRVKGLYVDLQTRGAQG